MFQNQNPRTPALQQQQAAPPAIQRRPPLANAPLNHVNHQPHSPPKPPPKVPHSPPLPRQKSKIPPPSPPKIITDKRGRRQFNRVGFLGEGGFARVYEVKDPRGTRFACKVITKESLDSKKAKTKLYAEIKIHHSLQHPNVVTFYDVFEDAENVYMTLELCPSGSLMDMLRRRRRFTEPECRFFMIQLMGACHYLHAHQVIHRDLKLGNMFLDANMNIKIGDFGLAALIESPGERKKTICGTPNYIAPEVLFDTNGHSFEVDTWSIGVILYTFIIGRPPFQTKDVKAIYKRIRDNEYEFPSGRVISSAAQRLIQHILTPDPVERPTLHVIADHLFFTQGPVPAYIPTSAHDAPPDFRDITRAASDANLKRLRKYALFDVDYSQPSLSSSARPPAVGTAPSATLGAKVKNITTSIAQQEKEFQKAVQPGSPISALLSSARQPLLMTNPGGNNGEVREPLLRKLQTVKESPLGRRTITQAPDGTIEERELIRRRRPIATSSQDEGDHEEEEMRLRKKELEAQKARIVAQMVPVREENEEENEGLEDKENRQITAKVHVPAPSSKPTTASAIPPPKINGFEVAAQTLTAAFEARSSGRVYQDPIFDPSLANLPDEKVFIVSWVDYCNKYGMGYALTDGSVGVHFNDSTSLVLSPDKVHFDYITSRRQGSAYVRKSYSVDTYPEELKSKVYLLKHFESYIMQRLYGDYEYTFQDKKREKGMEWVQKYLRMKHVIVFKLSHDVLQFNFYDHSKLILSSHGNLITHIDKHYKMTRWSLSEVMAQSLQNAKPAPPGMPHDPDAAKFNQKLVDKLKYCKEVLISIRTASAGTAVEDNEGPAGTISNQLVEGGAGFARTTVDVPVARTTSRMAAAR